MYASRTNELVLETSHYDRVENPSHTETAMTLHLYVPPYDRCHVFDERTGRTNEAHVTFYSVGGKLTSNE